MYLDSIAHILRLEDHPSNGLNPFGPTGNGIRTQIDGLVVCSKANISFLVWITSDGVSQIYHATWEIRVLLKYE
jgi:hypothetical protein